MEIEVDSVNLDENTGDCSPLSNVYYNLKMRFKGLSREDVNTVYDCNLCNNCHLAGLNLGTRQMAVDKSIILHHITEIKDNIITSGNSYGIIADKNKIFKGNLNDSHQKQRKTSREAVKIEMETVDTLLFRGCTPTHKTPELLQAAETLLKNEGVEYSVIDDETCCGNILYNLGDRTAGSEIVERNIEKFQSAGVKRIITVCPGCYNSFNRYYKDHEGFKPEVIFAVDLLSGLECYEELRVQDPCHARDKATVVRKIVQGALNKNPGPCCGAGGGVLAHNSTTASARAKKVLDNKKPRIVTYCPFCYLNLSSADPDKVTDIYNLLVRD